ncbi:hypothetical protein [Rossellomorea vietnamensis]|uniref:Uncharacterized protein n=1 Tax=Rossellomorea vietnamensis TaxID=218284 RepID=A0A0P6WI27_9BACI|nr:hypothetical protein [Rossellomorea vietnamensis]KPL60252.1 hypothetical protein AM506_06415 [Rossellomorea vietnamensis]
MIRNKKFLIASGVILMICRSLYFPYPNNKMIFERSTFMSFPISDQDGYNMLAIVGSIFFIFAMILLVKGISKYHFRTVILVLIAYSLLPLGLVSVYQETLASGISAISYDGEGTCDFESDSEDELNGECHLQITNHSGDPVTFDIEFLDSYIPYEDHRRTSLMNEGGPYRITVEANTEKMIDFKELLDVSDVPYHVDGGGSTNVHFKISDGERERVL